MNIEYREATESELQFGDVDSLIDLVEIESCDIVRRSIGVEPEATGRGNEDLVIVARDMDNEGCVAGIVLLREFFDMSAKICTLDDLYVKEKYRRMGIGTGLVRKAISMAQEHGKRMMLGVLLNNENGAKFWGRFSHFCIPVSVEYMIDYDSYNRNEELFGNKKVMMTCNDISADN